MVERMGECFVRRAPGEEPVVYPDGPGMQGYVLTPAIEAQLRAGPGWRGWLGAVCAVLVVLFPIAVELPLVLMEELVPLPLLRLSTPLFFLMVVGCVWCLWTDGARPRAALMGARPSPVPLTNAEVHKVTGPRIYRSSLGMLGAGLLAVTMFLTLVLPGPGKIVIGALLAVVLVPYIAGASVRALRRSR